MAVSDILAIWNDAVLNIGAKGSIASLTEQSSEAAACALRYEGVVQSVLRSSDWNCVRMTAALTDVTATFAAPARWAYRYTYPAACLRIWRMETPSGVLWQWPQPLQGYEVAIDLDPGNSDLPTKYIYSNMTSLSAIFTKYAYDSAHGYYEALFEPDLKEALGWALAFAISGSLTSNTGIVQNARAEAMRSLAVAQASSANESSPNSMDVPEAESLSIRGFNGAYAWPYADGLYWPYG